ncbi:MAG: DNA polymerase III subunit gamma/tau [Armatimonadetes bacterium]|nr:DNA polymerase III subunit gamma/tau [Armatimonadota bacterium]
MSYVPFSLRYRPQTFGEIVGQEHVSRTLQNAVASGRVVHGYLFAGPRGTGKTSTARVLAKALLCEHGPTPEPCGECSICRAIAAGRALDVIEIDAASNRGIEQIRELREKVRYSPAEARYKVYILDEVHMLTPEAFNALLKTLEEPPSHTFFVLATTELHKVPPTIVSRCQLFEFHLIPEPRIVESLRAIAEREGVEVEEGALEELARAARGALRDAESIFDQVVAYAEGRVTVETVRDVIGATPRESVAGLMQAMADGDLAAVLARLDDLVAAGKDLSQLVQDLMLATREMLRASLGVHPEGEWRELHKTGAALGSAKVAEALRLLGEAEKRLREATQQQLAVELALAEITQMWAEPSAQERALALARAGAERSTKPSQPGQTSERAGRRQAEPKRLAPTAEAETTRSRKRPAQSAETEEPGAEKTPATDRSVSEHPPAEETVGAETALPTSEARSPQASEALAEAAAGDFTRSWQAVYVALKRRRRVAVWAMLRESRPEALIEDQLVVRFPAGCKFHHERVNGDYRSDVEQALAEVFGRPVKLVALLGDEKTPTAPAPSGPAGKRPAAPEPQQPVLTPDEETPARAAELPAERRTAGLEPAVPEPRVAEREAVGEDEADRAARLALDFFEGSEEIPPE